MALSVAVGTFSASTLNDTQSITVGFQPKVVLFFASTRTSDGLTTGTISRLIGWMHASDEYAGNAYHVWEDPFERRTIAESLTQCVVIIYNVAGNTRTATPAATRFTSTTFAITWGETGSAYQINYVALGGDDITNVTSGTFSQATSGTPPVSKAITGLGFEPDLVCITTAVFPTSYPATANQEYSTWGIASKDGASIQNAASAIAVSEYYTDGIGTIRVPGTTNPRCLLNDANANYWHAKVTSFDSGGFTLAFDDVLSDPAYYHAYLAIKGITSKLGSITDPTSTGNQATTGVGFQPQGLLLWGGHMAASEDHQVGAAQLNFGAGTSSSARWSLAGGFVNNSYDDQFTAQSASTIYTAYYDQGSTPVVACQADLVSLDAGGFTLNWGTIDSTLAHAVIYWAFKGTAAEGVTRAPGSGTVQITGAAPTRIEASLRYPGTATLQIVGAAPQRLVGMRAQPGAGLLQIAGQQPLRVEASIRVPATGLLRVVGLAPARIEALLATPGTAVLLLAGSAPTALTGYVLAPSTGALQLLGIAPGVYEAHLRVPASALLRIVGAVPVLSVEGASIVTPARIIIAPVGFAA